MRSGLVITGLVLTLSVAWAEEKVNVLRGGQYYHRPSHLILEESRSVTLQEAAVRGFEPCPECTPDVMLSGGRRVENQTPYYSRLLQLRKEGALWGGAPVTGAKAKDKTSKDAEAQPQVVIIPQQKIPEFPKQLSLPPPPTETVVPATGGLMKSPILQQAVVGTNVDYQGNPIKVDLK